MKRKLTLLFAALMVLFGTTVNAQGPTQSEKEILFSLIAACGRMHQDAAQLGGTLQSLSALYYHGGNGQGVQNQISAKISTANDLSSAIGSDVNFLSRTTVPRGNRLIYGEIGATGQNYLTWRNRFVAWTNTNNPAPAVLDDVRGAVSDFKEQVQWLKVEFEAIVITY